MHGLGNVLLGDGPIWGWPLPGDGPVLDMLLESTFVGEDLVAEVAALLLGAEQQPEEEAVDPAHQAWQEGAAGTGPRGQDQNLLCVSCVQAQSEFRSLLLTPRRLAALLYLGWASMVLVWVAATPASSLLSLTNTP